MTALDEARRHLAKAAEFLEAAEVNHEFGLYSAATSNAVTAGINAKDAICLALTSRTAKADNHQEAATELRAAGPVGRPAAPTFTRLLRFKPKSQYQSAPMSAADARRAAEWARRLVDAAAEAIRG